MAGVNCKRYLQNKPGDRKRKPPNSALLESADTVDEQAVGDTQNPLRQPTRQSTQRHLSPVITNVSKVNKTDVTTRNTTTVSKKILRSTKQDNEQLNHDRMSLTNSDKPDVDNSKSTFYLENDNNYDFQREDENIKEKDMVKTLDDEADRNDEENRKEESKHIYTKSKTMTESVYQSSSYICYSSTNIALQNLKELNENTSAPSSSCNTSKEECGYEEFDDEDFQNNDRIPLVEGAEKIKENNQQNKKDKSYKNLKENNKVVIENIERLDNISKTKQAVSTHTTSHEMHENHMDKQNMNVSTSRTHLSENRNEQQLVHSNELSHLSNSLCSENKSIDPSYKKSIEHINNNFKPKETKQLLDNNIPIEKEENKKHLYESTNVTIKTSLQKSTNQPQNTLNVDTSKSPREDKYHHYNANEYNGCAIKSSPSTLSPVNITLRSKQEICNEKAVNPTFENICYDETVNKRECPDVQRSIEAVSNTDFKREEEAGSFNNLKTSVNDSIDNVIDNDCNTNTLKLNTTSFDQPRHLLLEEKDEEDPHEKLQLQLHNRLPQDAKNFEKCLKKSDALTTQQNDRITHQQNEKEIIDAADKVYTQIEEQYHQHHVTSISSTYNDLIINHSTNLHEREEHHQRHDVNSLPQLQTLQHTIHQRHYSSEPLYQLQQQMEHHQQTQMQRHQIQKQEELQKQHNIPPNSQREHRHNMHLMDFLHPQHHHSNVCNTHSPLHQQQQQHQIHEVYHDLMMDELHENHNTPYKLGISPSANKHENQDDGYETSAGDVLTPNSHASSTNSMTPQHNMQHVGLVKSNEPHQQNSIRLKKSQHNPHIINDQNRNIQQELVKKASTTNLTSGDTFHFMGDDINSGKNISLRHILTPPHSQTRSNQEGCTINGWAMQSEASALTPMNSTNDIYNLTKSSLHHHHSQKSCLGTHSNMPISNADHQHFTEIPTKGVNEEQNSILNLQTKTIQKRRGRKKKIPEGSLPQTLESSNANDVNSVAGNSITKERKKHDRFNGMSEEEVGKRILPDHLCENLDIVIVSVNFI